jgi:hypothetical protein
MNVEGDRAVYEPVTEQDEGRAKKQDGQRIPQELLEVRTVVHYDLLGEGGQVRRDLLATPGSAGAYYFSSLALLCDRLEESVTFLFQAPPRIAVRRINGILQGPPVVRCNSVSRRPERGQQGE